MPVSTTTTNKASKKIIASVLVSLPTALLAGFAAQSTIVNAIERASLSTTINACDNFYGYANEVWSKNAVIPDDRSRWGTFAEIKDRNDKVLKAAIAEAAAAPDKFPNPAIQKVATFYASGMDTAAIEAAGLSPIEPLFTRIAAIKSKQELALLFGELQRLGFQLGVGAGVSSDAKDRTRYLVQLAQGGLGLPDRDYYFRDDAKSKSIRDAYQALLAQMFTLTGDAEDVGKNRAAAVYKIEEAFAKASMTLVQQRDPKATYNKVKFSEFAAKNSGFDWAAYLAAQKLGKPGEVNIAQPLFAKAFAQMAQTVSLTDWQSYLKVHVLLGTSPKLAKRFEDAHFAFYGKLLDGKKTQRPREERVLEEISGRYGEAPLAEGLGQLFVEKSFSAEAKTKAVAMTQNIKAALRERLQGLPWMQAATKAAAIKKLDAMALQIGYPDKWKDVSGVTVSKNEYAGNWMRANAFNNDWWAAKLGTPVDRNQWGMSPQIVNAYAGEYNEIVFPAGILQPPFFDAKADDATNYGAIGMVIGHEITHHFDDQGRQFDLNGNLKEWWTPKDNANYKARAEALVKQYGSYKGAGGVSINGRLTLGENIADLGGLTISYLGLERSLKGASPKGTSTQGATLTGSPMKTTADGGFTPAQKFFLSYAQSWRDKTRDEAEIKQLQTDSHSPARYRVLGPLAHIGQFADAFGCKANSAGILPANKQVVIW